MKMRPQVCPLGVLLNTILNNKEEKMKKLIVLILVVIVLVFSFGSMVIAVPAGPAPNAGDGISDGSGLDNKPLGYGIAPGPAPSSGDGIPDGSGF